MPLFKTKYNDAKKAIKAISKGQDYDFSRAGNELFNDRQFLLTIIEKLGTRQFDSVKYRAGDWIYKDDEIMLAAIYKDRNYGESVFDKVSKPVQDAIENVQLKKIEKYDEALSRAYTNHKGKNKIFLWANIVDTFGEDKQEARYYNEELEKFKEIDIRSAMTGALANIDHETFGKEGFLYMPKSKTLFFMLDYDRYTSDARIGICIEDRLAEQKGKLAYAVTYINAGRPDLMPHAYIEIDKLNEFDFDKWIQIQVKTEKVDAEFMKKVIIPCVDKLLQGKRVLLSTKNENSIPQTIQQVLWSMPAETANKFSFNTIPCVKTMRNDFQISGTTDLTKFKRIPHDVFVVDVEKGFENYIPQTEMAKQMLAQIAQDLDTQSSYTQHSRNNTPKTKEKRKDFNL